MGLNQLDDPIRKSIMNLIWRTPFALRQWPGHDVLLLFLLRSYTHAGADSTKVQTWLWNLQVVNAVLYFT